MADPDISFLPGFGEDVRNLLRPHQIVVLNLLFDVANGKVRGLPLEHRTGTGDLSDCRKLYFDADPAFDDSPRFRLVYREMGPGAVRAVQIQAVAAGRRAHLEAYQRAARNLGRGARGTAD